MNKFLLILTFVFYSGFAYTQDVPQDDNYHFYLNLNEVQNDELKVTLITPKISETEITYYMPKVIPGTYRISDFGRFISDLKAFSVDGEELSVEKIEVNSWKIGNADKLYKLQYNVEDTYDAVTESNQIIEMSGTNIEEGENFMINTHGFFGYFDDMKQTGYNVSITHPQGFFGATAMSDVSTENNTDLFITKSYNRLVDSPIMYARPDTTVMEVGGAKILVSVYSPGDKVKSRFMADKLSSLLIAQKEYLGGTLPVDKYAFIMYFQDMSKARKNKDLGGFAFGALEHSYSSVYYLPDADQEDLAKDIMRIAAHEFFHIVTPLSIHSEEIQYFDFNTPQMSEHLWLYEGVIEYFAHHVQVQYGLTSKDDFLNSMSAKISGSLTKYDDSLPFTVLSKGSLEQYQDQYLNVYEKGALIGMCIDLELRKLSNGTYGVNDLVIDLSKRYGKDNAFKDEELFGVITELTYPEIGEFLNKYVAGSAPLPLNQVLNYAGAEYLEKEKYKDFSLGGVQLGYDPDAKALFVADADNMDKFGKELGYKKNDELFSVNGLEISKNLAHDLLDRMIATMKEGEESEVIVLRKNAAGEKEKVTLTAETIKTDKERSHVIKLIENPSPGQMIIRNSWLEQ